MGWLVSPAVLISGLGTGVDATPDPALGLAATGVAGLLAAVWERLGRHRVAEPPLASRPLALPPVDLDLDMAAVRDGLADPDRTAASAGEAVRPLWVRRMDEWLGPPPGRRLDPNDGWDPRVDFDPVEVPVGWLPEADRRQPEAASRD
jgi:hypothetical protein